MSYYLKYRPQTVAELDLTTVREAFVKILSSGTFSHAYLFTGPKGTGKTSSARILAKVLNCERNRNKAQRLEEPCNECASCKAIINGSSLSVLEMDGASNRGIDDVRLLRDRVALAPADAPYAVYVIDEVHMLTTEAFNALLKTLEEPPRHAVFVLCTTELHKVPATIISRCTTISFTKATVGEISHSLTKAVTGEKLEVEKGALELIAQRADGSFRDAMKFLEQLGQDKSTISVEHVNELTGYSESYNPDKLIEALLKQDVMLGLEEIKKRHEQGVDITLYGKRLVERLREHFLKMVTASTRNEVWIDEMIRLIERITRAVLEMKTAVIPSLPLEVAVVEWGRGKTQVPTANNQEPHQKLPESQKGKPDTTPQPLDKVKKLPENNESENDEATKKAPLSITIDEVKMKWAEIMRGVRPYNHSLEALLRAARPLDIEGDRLVIEVFYTFHKEQLEVERHRQVIEKVLSGIFQGPMKLRFTLGSKAKKALSTAGEGVANITGAVADEKVVEAVEEIFGQ